MKPRQVAMHLIRTALNFSYEKIGADFGGKIIQQLCMPVTRLKNVEERSGLD